MLGEIKKAAMDAIDASKPAAVMYGEVITADPLSVNIDQRFTLTADFLVVPESLTKYEVEVDSQTITIRPGLLVGDKLLLLRMQGGQKFIILDKLVST